VTSKDVARAAGVSQTTVSFVLNGRDQHGISAQTRQLVADTAARLGYVPSAAARSLRAGRSNLVVGLLPDLPVTEAFEVLKRQLSAALAAHGYTCLFLELAAAGGGLAEVWQHVEPAAVVSFGVLPDADAEVLRAAGVPVVDGVLQPEGSRLQGLDQGDIGRLQVRHLAERGHVRIGFAGIDDPRETPFSHPRLLGAREACRELGLPGPVEVSLHYSRASADAALDVLLGPDPVTAVAAHNDLVALALLGAGRSRGVRVPEDLAVVGVDDLPAAGLGVPSLSTVALDLEIPARSLAATVLALIPGAVVPAPVTGGQVLRLVVRESTGGTPPGGVGPGH
jgi:DNA-binding LacI/PurR family transcriptional regulator